MDIASPTHLVTLRGLLAARLRGLQAELRHADPAAAESGTAGEVIDQKDVAEHAMRTGVSDAEERMHLTEVAEIERALRRLDAGTYGNCLVCGEPIPLQRLLVMPAAERCTACQAAGERGA